MKKNSEALVMSIVAAALLAAIILIASIQESQDKTKLEGARLEIGALTEENEKLAKDAQRLENDLGDSLRKNKSLAENLSRKFNELESVKAANASLADDRERLINGQKVIESAYKRGEILVDYLEDLLRHNEDRLSIGDAAAAKKIIRPVAFFPSDYDIDEDEVEKYLPEINRAFKVIQAWYLREVGATFSLAAPINFKGGRTVQEYNDLYDHGSNNAAMLAEVLYDELGDLRDGNTHPVVFLYGFDARFAFGQEGRLAIIPDNFRTPLMGRANDRYRAIYALAHELGHIFGLDHSGPERANALMLPTLLGEWREIFLPAFPDVKLDEREKGAIRDFLSK